jgi:hypothetical protein
MFKISNLLIGECCIYAEYVNKHENTQVFFRAHMVAASSPFCAFIQNVTRQFGRICIHVVDAVLMVTKGHKMVKRDDLQNLAPMGYFCGLLMTIRILVKGAHAQSLSLPVIKIKPF